MVTDTRMLLIEGMKLAAKTFAAARLAMGWAVEELDEFVVHQVSRVHTDTMIKAFGIDPKKVTDHFCRAWQYWSGFSANRVEQTKRNGSLEKRPAHCTARILAPV